jgi:hypothetical protein
MLKDILNEFRLSICDFLFNAIVKIVPKEKDNDEGQIIIRHIMSLHYEVLKTDKVQNILKRIYDKQ